MSTANLALPYIEAAQAQKHVTHNEALQRLDALVQLAVADRDLNAPPGSPSEGQRFIVKASPAPTGAWVGHGNHIAAWQDGGWQFSAPQTGWVAFVADEGTLLVWNGVAWGDFFSTVTTIQNLARLGVGTTADATNPFSAKLNNALWVAKTVAEGGDGHLRYKLSKESAAKTLSFLLQDNFSGRAEIGLTGDDDLHFKVSADGATWFEGLRLDRNTGRVAFPAMGGPRETLAADRTYYVRTDGSDANSGLANSAGGAFLTLQKAMDTIVATLDLAGFTVTVQVANGTYTGGVDIRPWTGGGHVIFLGNTGTPANVLINVTADNCFDASFGPLPGKFTINGFKLQANTSGFLICARSSGRLIYTNVDFGAAPVIQVLAAYQGFVGFYGTNTISGNSVYHFFSTGTGIIACSASDLPAIGLLTLSGTRTFSGAFAHSDSLLDAQGFTFSGTATGTKRYDVTANGKIVGTGGAAAFFPGDAAGTTGSGGQYL